MFLSVHSGFNRHKVLGILCLICGRVCVDISLTYGNFWIRIGKWQLFHYSIHQKLRVSFDHQLPYSIDNAYLFHFSTDYMPENITYALAEFPSYNILPVYGKFTVLLYSSNCDGKYCKRIQNQFLVQSVIIFLNFIFKYTCIDVKFIKCMDYNYVL